MPVTVDSPAPPSALKTTFTALGQANEFFRRWYDDRLFMAGLTALSLVIYLWNAPHSIDYPQYDEAWYFSRAYHLLHGDRAYATVSDLRTSPLIVVYYALWYALLHTDLLYPWVYASSLALMGIGAYLLFSRLLHPMLSWVLALFAVIAAGPVVTSNGLYYFGTGLLWLSLALLGPRAYQRGLAVLGVLVAAYARPEYLLVAGALVVGLGVYEWRQWRQWRDKGVSWRGLALAYAPLACGGLVTAYLLHRTASSDADRVEAALPWSYNDFLRIKHPSEFQGIASYSQPWVNFNHDFAPVPEPHTITSMVLSMTHNSPRMVEYLAYEAQQLWQAIVSSALYGYGWTSDEWHTNLQVVPTALDMWLFGASLLLFAAIAIVCYLSLRRRHLLDTLPVRRDVPALIGVASLATLFGPLLLINSFQRFWMLFPVALVPVGYGLTIIATRLRLRSSLLLAVLVVGLALIPEPYATTPNHPIARTLDFLRTHVPEESTIIGEPMTTFQVYLASEGFHLNVYDTSNIPEPVLVNAFKADPSVSYLLADNWSYLDSTYERWFADWNTAFPRIPWKLVAQEQDPNLKLYKLSGASGIGRKLIYDAFLQRAHQLGTDTTTLPTDAAMDFTAQITWHSSNPQNNLQPTALPAWGVSVPAVLMSPPYPGIAPSVPTQMTTSLPAGWSGHGLLFLATLSPWSVGLPDVNGVRLIFTLDQGGAAQSFEVNNLQQQNWVPIVVQLPQYSGSATLTVQIVPRASVDNTTTYLGFLGAAQPTGGNG